MRLLKKYLRTVKAGFNGCLNQFWFRSIKEAREIIENWRTDYNEVRPHSALRYQPPSVLAEATA